MTQRKLIENEIEKLKQARSSINDVLVPTYDDQGQYWAGVLLSLDDKIKHGTTDGKPYVEPEPPIPEGYRKALDNEHCRKDVKLWDKDKKQWSKRLFPSQPFLNGDRYIVSIDPPLTDEDAAVWPRLLVMVRDDESKPWRGPVELHGICPGSEFPFSYMGINDKLRGIAVYARRATPEEIEAAK